MIYTIEINAEEAYNVEYTSDNIININASTVIDDENTAIDKTYSSQKIQEELDNISNTGGATIDDVIVSETTTFSSEKIQNEVTQKQSYNNKQELLYFTIEESEIEEGNRNAIVRELPDGKLVAAKFSSAGVDVSTDGGSAWTTTLADIHPNGNPRVDFIDSNGNLYTSKVLAGQSGLLYRSTDNGDTWSLVLDTAVASPSLYANALWYMAEDSSGNLYCQEYSFGSEEVSPGVPRSGWQALNVYRSQDQGQTWSGWYTHPDTNLRHLHLVFVDSTDQIYVAGAHNRQSATALPDVTQTFLVNPDGTQGAILTPASILGGATGAIEADDGTVFFGSDRENGVWRLNKDDNSLTNVLDFNDSRTPEDQILDMVKGKYGVLYAIGNVLGLIYASPDDGKTWAVSSLPDNFDNGNPTVATVSLSSNDKIYLDRGDAFPYYTIPDYTKEQIWQKIYSNTKVTSVNGLNGDVNLSADDFDTTSTTNKFITQSKLDKIDSSVQLNGDQTINNVKTFAGRAVCKSQLANAIEIKDGDTANASHYIRNNAGNLYFYHGTAGGADYTEIKADGDWRISSSLRVDGETTFIGSTSMGAINSSGQISFNQGSNGLGILGLSGATQIYSSYRQSFPENASQVISTHGAFAVATNRTGGAATSSTDIDFTILKSGNVGIGKTNPAQKLDVSGNILASGTINGSNISGTNTGDETATTIANKTGVTGAGDSKYYGTNSSGTAGVYDLPVSSGFLLPAYIETCNLTHNNQHTATPNQLFYSRVTPQYDFDVNKLQCYILNINGTTDPVVELGIYNDSFAKLGSASVTATASGIVEVTFSSTVSLAAGSHYFFALLNQNNDTDTTFVWASSVISNNTNIQGFLGSGSSMVATITSPVGSGRNYWIRALS